MLAQGIKLRNIILLIFIVWGVFFKIMLSNEMVRLKEDQQNLQAAILELEEERSRIELDLQNCTNYSSVKVYAEKYGFVLSSPHSDLSLGSTQKIESRELEINWADFLRNPMNPPLLQAKEISEGNK